MARNIITTTRTTRATRTERAKSALARASMMRNEGSISASTLAEAVRRAWPSIEVES